VCVSVLYIIWLTVINQRLAWAELYMVIAAVVQKFDFEFDGAGPKDVVCASDRFIIGTADSTGIKAYVTERRV
jgi:hypothetical protein